MQLHLNRKSALITGASQGIGKEVAMQLAKEGVRVILTSNDEDKLNDACDEINKDGGSARAIYADLTLQKDIDNLNKNNN
ncbi:MAG: SDR family NAD(P)-dependent oxidoreductase [Gammaproteobacteria bacterium]|nr:SDR family NAD(P)-dependent oxidoreductase [Gammaproteobacteria bacterium]